ncbi:MAG: hypothetical protein QW211_01230 [Desulfurococcaceae archaeon]
MPRISSGSYVKELDLLDVNETILLLEELSRRGVNEVKLLLEPCTIEVLLNNRVHTIAMSSPALILDHEAVNPENPGFYNVVKDTWAEYVAVNLQILLSFLRALIQGESTLINDVSIEVRSACLDCDYLYPLERLLLKYSTVHRAEPLDFNVLESLHRNSLKENKIILVACITEESAHPYVWLEINGGRISINTCRLSHRKNPVMVGSLIDAFLYVFSSHMNN